MGNAESLHGAVQIHGSAVQVDHDKSTKRNEPSFDTTVALNASKEPLADEYVQTGSVSHVHQINDEESAVDENVQTGSASHVSYSRLSSYQGPTRTVVGGFTAPITAPDEESPVHESVQKGSASHTSYPRLSSYQGPTKTVVPRTKRRPNSKVAMSRRASALEAFR